MFYLNKDTELSIELLQKMIKKFRIEVEPKLSRYKNYYDGLQYILNKKYADATKPCNKTVINYCKNIVDSYCGYLATPSYISYSSKNDIEEIMDILRYNDYQSEDSDYLQDALIYGTAAELMYIDATGQTRFRLISPLQCFGVYDDSLTGDLLYFVRMYRASEWDNSDLYNVDVYSDYDIKHYTMSGSNGNLMKFTGEEPHYFNQCPANIFTLPDSKSIFDCVMSLQDSANELLSAEIDDYSAFCDAYLVLLGVDADADDIASMKENRVLVLPEGANATWLTKSANDAQVENILKRIHDSIYRIAQCPDFSSETFVGGVSSGIAIRYRLTGMENKAGIIEGRMKKALQRRIEIICGIASLKYGEEVFRDINIEFKRNVPEDNTALINMVNSLKGSVSDATLLGLLPFVEDVNAELEALEKQRAANMELYGFGTSSGTDEEEE
jgi:SPP1 family phage portal protein